MSHDADALLKLNAASSPALPEMILSGQLMSRVPYDVVYASKDDLLCLLIKLKSF